MNNLDNPEYISDPDDEDNVRNLLVIRHRSSNTSVSLIRFLESKNFSVSFKDAKNFWSQGQPYRSYNVTKKYLPRFFKILEQCRKEQVPMNMTEFQYIPHANDDQTGLYIDFDIKQRCKEIIFQENDYFHIIEIIFKQLVNVLEIDDDAKTCVGITVRSSIDKSKDKQYYRFGFHIIIPGIKVTKRVKKYLYHVFNTQSLLPSYMKTLEPKGVIYQKECIDINSAHVPTLLIGSAKFGRKPYELKHIFDIQMTKLIAMDEEKNEDQHNIISTIISPNNTLLSDDKFNPVAEFCLSYTPYNPLIPRKSYDIKPHLSNKIVDMTIDDYLPFENDLDMEISELERRHPDASYVKLILDLLAKHIDSFNWRQWSKIFAILAKEGNEFKCLAKYFSSKSSKWEEYESKFEDNWTTALKPEPWKIHFHLPYLYNLARELEPEEYNKARQQSIYNMMWDKITDRFKMGNLGDADWAELIYMLKKDKYIVDYDPGTHDRIWYEFITSSDQHKEGELWKWRKYSKNHPESLHKYISIELPRFCENIYDGLDRDMNRPDVSSELLTWLTEVKKSFKASVRKLYLYPNKISILYECMIWFSKRGFANKLDENPMALGVGQGILILDKNGNPEKLVVNYNDDYISRYTTVRYPDNGFDPSNPKTKRLLLAFRTMFPDDEASTHLFMACFLASTLDQRLKTGLFLICTGEGQNGKSFLLELHRNMLEDSNITGYSAKMRIAAITTPIKSSEGAAPGVMQLQYARLAHYSESDQNASLNSGTMKEYTGGETVTARSLYKNMQSFRPKCQHIITSNNDLTITDTDWGTWRRIKCMLFKMRFYDPDDYSSDYDPNDPLHRKGDRDLLEKIASDPEYLSAWLSIMVFYHRILMKYFDGKVEKVPHEHIVKTTREFRNSQDNMSRFIEQRIVEYKITEKQKKKLLKKLNHKNHNDSNDIDMDSDDDDDNVHEENIDNIIIDQKGICHYPLSMIIDAYKNWYDETYSPAKHNNKQITKMFITRSQLKNHIKKTKDGYIIVGWKALAENEKPKNRERFSIGTSHNISAQTEGDAKTISENKYKLPSTETPDEYLERIHREFRELESIDKSNDKSNDCKHEPIIDESNNRRHEPIIAPVVHHTLPHLTHNSKGHRRLDQNILNQAYEMELN